MKIKPILKRIGNKAQFSEHIEKYFLPHSLYIELFAGTGSMFFGKKRAKFNILNDIDKDIFNMWEVLKFKKELLAKELHNLIIHEEVWKKYRHYTGDDEVFRAALFLFFSNFGYMGTGYCLKHTPANTKKIILDRLDSTFDAIQNVTFTCCDFRDVLPTINFSTYKDVYIYADPPYISATKNHYKADFGEKDFVDMLDILVSSGFKFGISEYGKPIILDYAKQYGLQVNYVCNKRTMANRNNEVLLTNYECLNLFTNQEIT